MKKHQPTAVAIAIPQKNKKTLVVVGSGRGGTSMVAGVAHILGIRMMEEGRELNSEDSEIVNAYQNNIKHGYQQATREVLKVVSQRNERYDVWGWKDPSADMYLESVVTQLRNPHFVFVFRNMLDVALSHVATGTGSIEIGLDSAIKRYDRYWRMLQRFGCPTLLVSYERALSNPSDFVNELSEFMCEKPTRAQVKKALKFIDPRGGYRFTF